MLYERKYARKAERQRKEMARQKRRTIEKAAPDLYEALEKIRATEKYRRQLIGTSDLSSPELPKGEIERIAEAAIAKVDS